MTAPETAAPAPARAGATRWIAGAILLKKSASGADDSGMRWLSLLVLALSGLAFAPTTARLPDGDGNFHLGASRSQVDSMIVARGLHVISDHSGFLATTSDDSLVDFEQYVFFSSPAGPSLLWRVTLGYRLDATRETFDAVEAELKELLGDPTVEPPLATSPEGRAGERRLAWGDAGVKVQLGARWGPEGDAESNRMRVTWTDARLQRLIDAHRKKERASASN